MGGAVVFRWLAWIFGSMIGNINAAIGTMEEKRGGINSGYKIFSGEDGQS
jgi:hypothetical protein